MKKAVQKYTWQNLYRRSNRFKWSNAIFVLVCIGLLIGVKVLIDKVLTEYELAQPIYTAREYISCLEGGDYSLLTLDGEGVDFDRVTDKERNAYFAQIFAHNITLDENGEKSGETNYRYRLRLGSGEELTMKMEVAGSTQHGFNTWAVTEISPVRCKTESMLVRVPECTIITAGGKQLTEDNIIKSDIPSVYDAYLPENAYNFDECIYKIDYFLHEPEIVVTNESNEILPLVIEDDLLIVQTRYDDTLAKYEQNCIDIYKQITSHIVGYSRIYDLNSIAVADSNAASTIQEYTKWGSVKAGTAKFEAVSVSNYLKLSDDCFCCDIDGKLISSIAKPNDTVYDTRYRIFFKVVDAAVKTYDFVLL